MDFLRALWTIQTSSNGRSPLSGRQTPFSKFNVHDAGIRVDL